jgi:hypothetical protein|tara:strand:- start:92 stop:514 length:423 start_codon:yes stop_codon:yes gene_type:complete
MVNCDEVKIVSRRVQYQVLTGKDRQGIHQKPSISHFEISVSSLKCIWLFQVAVKFYLPIISKIKGCQPRSKQPKKAKAMGINHVVLEVGDIEAVLEEMDVEMLERGLNFRDLWGNRIEVVPYEDIQFSKAPNVLRGMGPN